MCTRVAKYWRKEEKKMLWNVVYLPLKIIQTLPYRSYRLSGQCHVLIYSFCCFVSNIIKAFLDSKASSSWNNALMSAVLCVSLFTFLMIKVWGKGLHYAAYYWPCRLHLSTIWKSVRIIGGKKSKTCHLRTYFRKIFFTFILKNRARGNQKTLKISKLMLKLNFRNLKL